MLVAPSTKLWSTLGRKNTVCGIVSLFAIVALLIVLKKVFFCKPNLETVVAVRQSINLLEDRYILFKYETLMPLWIWLNFYPAENATFKIPKVCYQTWSHKDVSKMTKGIQNILARNKFLNPDIDFVLWDDDDIDKFIANEFPAHVHHAFRSINPSLGAAKADFFRYCILYKKGGIYLDLKSSIKIPGVFGNVIKPDDEAILDIKRIDKMAYRSVWDYASYEQWFLVFAPNHPYLEKMINLMSRSIHEKTIYEGASTFKEKVLRLTGPDAYAVAIHEAVVQYGIRHREIDYFNWLRYKTIITKEYKNANKVHYGSVPINSSLYATITTSSSAVVVSLEPTVDVTLNENATAVIRRVVETTPTNAIIDNNSGHIRQNKMMFAKE